MTRNLRAVIPDISGEPANLKASMKLLKGGTTIEDAKQIEVSAGTVIKVFDIDMADAPAVFLFLKLEDGKGAEVTTNEYFIPAGKDSYDWSKTTWVNTPITQYASYAMLDDMCSNECKLSVANINGGYEVTVSNPTEKVAFMVRLTAKDQHGQLICPAYWSDNYFSLAPGDSRTITCQMPSLPADTQVSITIE